MVRQRLLTGTVSNMLAKFVSVSVWFVLTPFVLEHVGTSGYALWVLVGAIDAYGSLLDLGICGAVVKYVAEHVARGERDAARAVIASASWLYLALGLITAALAFVVGPHLPALLGIAPSQQGEAAWIVTLTGIDIALAIAATPPVSILRGLQRYDLYNAVNVLSSLLLALATVGALVTGWGVLGMVAVNIPVMLAMRVLCTYLIKRNAPDLTPRWRGANRAAFRQIASFSSSLLVMDVATRLQSRTDEFVIAFFRLLSAVTPYALARKLGELTELVGAQFLKVVMPLASELAAADSGRRLRGLYIVSSRVALGIATLITLVLMILGGPILTLWVGAEYASYGPLVAVLSLASFFSIAEWPAREILQGVARHRIVAITSLVAGIANIALSIWMLPRFGLIGVALGTLIPKAVECLLVVIPFTNRMLTVSPYEALVNVWLPSLVPGAAAAAVLGTLRWQFGPPTLVMLVNWVAAAALVYGLGYLRMPASTAERRLLADLAAGSSRHVRRLLPALSRAR